MCKLVHKRYVHIRCGAALWFQAQREPTQRCDIRLRHGSLCVMENVCQFLYKHSLLPECGADGIRVNLTFRSKNPVRPARPAAPLVDAATQAQFQAPEPPSRPGPGPDASTSSNSAGADAGAKVGDPSGITASLPAAKMSDTTFVGMAPGVDHRPAGWKNQLHHAFESPFVDDPPAQAAARYATWIQAQPVFFGWTRRQLAGRTITMTSPSI